MSEFLADIAGMLEMLAVAGGLVLLHRAAKDAAAPLLRAAGWILVVGGVAVGACTTYYWFQYRAQGAFQTAYMMVPGQGMTGTMGPGGMAGMMPGGVMPGMAPGTMQPGAMQPGTMQPSTTPPGGNVPGTKGADTAAAGRGRSGKPPRAPDR